MLSRLTSDGSRRENARSPLDRQNRQTASWNTGTNATVVVRGGVSVGTGATFILGFEQGGSTGRINGGIVASGASSVQVHFARVNGGVSIQGGEGFFSTVEDSVIHGGATINGYRGFWLGFIRNTVSGTVTLSNNVMDDPDANEFVTNTIRGNLVCFGNSPALLRSVTPKGCRTS
jgi:hypothetical protein